MGEWAVLGWWDGVWVVLTRYVLGIRYIVERCKKKNKLLNTTSFAVAFQLWCELVVNWTGWTVCTGEAVMLIWTPKNAFDVVFAKDYEKKKTVYQNEQSEQTPSHKKALL